VSIPKPPYAEGQEFTNDVTGVTYKFDGVKWIASSGSEEIDLSGYVRKVGGDSMQGPLNVQVQPNTGSRETNRVQTLGVFTNSASSALRLGTNRDRVYVGDSDTSFNGPIKVDELQDKNGNGVKYEGKTSGPNNIQNRQSVLDITDPIAADVSQNTQDIASLQQEVGSNASVDDATKSTKGIAFLGQANTGTSTAPSLKSGQLYWNTSTKTLYVGN